MRKQKLSPRLSGFFRFEYHFHMLTRNTMPALSLGRLSVASLVIILWGGLRDSNWKILPGRFLGKNATDLHSLKLT